MKDGSATNTFFDRFDIFGVQMPQFTLEGKKRVGSCIGCTLSVFLLAFISTFTIVKFYFMVTGEHP
jgi:hypothetical protein